MLLSYHISIIIRFEYNPKCGSTLTIYNIFDLFLYFRGCCYEILVYLSQQNVSRRLMSKKSSITLL